MESMERRLCLNNGIVRQDDYGSECVCMGRAGQHVLIIRDDQNTQRSKLPSHWVLLATRDPEIGITKQCSCPIAYE
jgi:hypothetical protein